MPSAGLAAKSVLPSFRLRARDCMSVSPMPVRAARCEGRATLIGQRPGRCAAQDRGMDCGDEAGCAISDASGRLRSRRWPRG